MNRAAIVVPVSSPTTGDTPMTTAPAAPVNPSSARAWTANDMFRATTKRLTIPDTMATTIPAAIAFWTKSYVEQVDHPVDHRPAPAGSCPASSSMAGR